MLDGCTDVLRPVVTTYDLWLSSPGNDLLEGANHAFGWQGEIDFDPQGFAVEVINDIEQPEVSAILQLVVHEVHGPDLIDGLRHAQWLRLFAYQALAGLDAQVQLQLPVNPVDSLVVPLVALDVAQVQVAQAKAPVAVVVRQAQQPVSDLLILDIVLGLVPIARLAHAKYLARCPYG